MSLSGLLGEKKNHFKWLFDPEFNLVFGLKIDLGRDNPDLRSLDIHTMHGLDNYIESLMFNYEKKFAYGGYGEHREFYRRNPIFLQGDPRTLRLGTDFWVPAFSVVYLSLDGTIHGFSDNAGTGNYGPIVITQHQLDIQLFFLLFGHPSRSSLNRLRRGARRKKGEIIGLLGCHDENGNRPPHLHFQNINDLKGSREDYPGVASVKESSDELKNCPDPSIIYNL